MTDYEEQLATVLPYMVQTVQALTIHSAKNNDPTYLPTFNLDIDVCEIFVETEQGVIEINYENCTISVPETLKLMLKGMITPILYKQV